MPRYRSSITSLKEDNESAVHSRKSFSTNFRRRVREESIVNKKSMKEASDITMNSLFNKRTDNLNQTELERFRKYKEEYIQGDAEKKAKIVEYARRTISYGNQLPVDEAIASGVVPCIIESVSLDMSFQTIYDALWILTNIASKNEGQAKYLVDNQLLPRLNMVLKHSPEDVKDQAIWVLANLSGDVGQLRDYIINSQPIPAIIEHLKSGIGDTLATTAIWALSNFCNGQTPRPDFRQIQEILPVMAYVLGHAFNRLFKKDPVEQNDFGNPYCVVKDTKAIARKPFISTVDVKDFHDDFNVRAPFNNVDIDIIRDAVTSICYILESNGNMDEKIMAFKSIQPDILEQLVLICKSDSPNQVIKKRALRIFGVISKSPICYPEFLHKYDIVETIFGLLSCGETSVIKDAAWALSNICSFGPDNIKYCVGRGLGQLLVDGFCTRNNEIKSELTMIIYNVLQKAELTDLLTLFDRKLLRTILDLVNSRFFNSRKMGLLMIKRLLERTKDLTQDGAHPYAQVIREMDGIDIIEKSQEESNPQIYDLASEIIIEFFGGEEVQPDEQLKNELF